MLVRKVGAPLQPELAGAGEKMEIVVNEDVVSLGLPKGYVEKEAARQVEEIERRRRPGDGVLHAFKLGAFATALAYGLPILPVAIAGTFP